MRVRFLLAAAAVVACSESATSEVEGDAAQVDAGGDARASGPMLLPRRVPEDFSCEPDLAYLERTVFATTCGWETCHGVLPAFGLSLLGDPEHVHGQLVNQPAVGCRGWSLVVPGDPDASFLVNKIEEMDPACGEFMPRGVVPLPPEVIDCIREWISSLTISSP